jgi:hypothetical protein
MRSTKLALAAAALAMLAPAPASQAATHRFLTGIGDEHSQMFQSALWQKLHVRIARYVAPYDAAASPSDLAAARTWIAAALAQHQQILVAFYHSRRTPTRMPSNATYRKDVQRFIRLFPQVHQYQPWNEANRGNVPHLFDSPSAKAAAGYYAQLRAVCRHCTLIGLDVLDQQSIRPTLTYIAQFKAALRRLRVPQPSIWGLHNYSDTNRLTSTRTRAVLKVIRGRLWLTETGGIVQFGSQFPNKNGSGLKRAQKAIQFMFRIAASNPRIDRLYVYSWTGGLDQTRFDAGLTNPDGSARPGYSAVCAYLRC